MQKVNPWLRFGITGVIFVLFILSLVQWGLFDGWLKNFWPVPFSLAIIVGVVCGGITYGVLPVKKTIREAKVAYADSKRRPRVVGYLAWLACWALFYCIWMFVRIYDL